MSELEEKISAKLSLSNTSAEYEKAYITCKKLSKTLNKAILGQASKEEIENSIIEMQSSLEIVKYINKTSTTSVEKGVNEKFGIKTSVEPKVTAQPKSSSKSSSKSSTTRRK